MNTKDLIAEREKRYGDFTDNAKVAQELKLMVRRDERWGELTLYQKESLDLILSKIGRIMSGDKTYVDNWADIAGYAQLVVDRLNASAAGEQHG